MFCILFGHQFWSSFLFCENFKWYPRFFVSADTRAPRRRKKNLAQKRKSSFNDQTEVSSVDPSHPMPDQTTPLFEKRRLWSRWLDISQAAGKNNSVWADFFVGVQWSDDGGKRPLQLGLIPNHQSAWTFIRSMAAVYGWTFWCNLYQNSLLCHMPYVIHHNILYNIRLDFLSFLVHFP